MHWKAVRPVHVFQHSNVISVNAYDVMTIVEAPIYPNARLSSMPAPKSSSHLIYSLEQNLAAEIRSQLIDNPETQPPNPSSAPSDVPNIHVISQPNSQPQPMRMFPGSSAFSIVPSRRPEYATSPFSSRPSTCPSTPRSVSPALSQTGEPPVFLSVLAKNRCTRRLGEHTGCWGTLYSSGDDVTFYIETDNAEDTAIELEFYVEVPQNPPENGRISISMLSSW